MNQKKDGMFGWVDFREDGKKKKKKNKGGKYERK